MKSMHITKKDRVSTCVTDGSAKVFVKYAIGQGAYGMPVFR